MRDLVKNLLTARLTQLLTPLLVTLFAGLGVRSLTAGSTAGAVASAVALALVIVGEVVGKLLLHKLLDQLQAHGVQLDNPLVKEVLTDLQMAGLKRLKEAADQAARAGPPLVLLALLVLPAVAGGCQLAQGLVQAAGQVLLPPPASPAGQPPSPADQVRQAHQAFDLTLAGLNLARAFGQIDDGQYARIDADVQAGTAALDTLDRKAAALAAGETLSLADYLNAVTAATDKLKAHKAAADARPRAAPAPATRPADPPDLVLSGDAAGDVAPVPGPVELR